MKIINHYSSTKNITAIISGQKCSSKGPIFPGNRSEYRKHYPKWKMIWLLGDQLRWVKSWKTLSQTDTKMIMSHQLKLSRRSTDKFHWPIRTRWNHQIISNKLKRVISGLRASKKTSWQVSLAHSIKLTSKFQAYSLILSAWPNMTLRKLEIRLIWFKRPN